ncbi:MAG: ATP/GTP-binding protein, partial [Actinomycetota bacterium]|nr:ATP/GTP-binding protein [Actinomycetota bacterium]
MNESAEELYQMVLRGDRRAISRLITMVEEDRPVARETLRLLFRRQERAHVIGLTGPPGSGKSTLAARLAEHYREAKKTVGIICIDPTSPFTGGALLGDRVRMQELFCDEGVFIRSMGTRGSLGGLAVAT